VPVSRNQPSPQRQSVLSFVSPKVADLLFFETVDAQKIGNTPKEIEANLPAYGTAHPDTENFPNHKLCFVKQADANGLMYEYYYAADRASQDDYNFEFSQADLGGNEYDTVVRTYVIKREDFDDDAASHEAGDAMPNTALRVDDTTFFSGSYILMGRQQKRIGDETLDGLFVVEQRIYIRYEDKVTFNTDLEFNDELKTTEILAYVGKTNVPTKAGNITWAADSSATRANWGIKAFDLSLTDNDGVYNYEVQRLSTDWWKITEQQIVGSNLYNGYVFKTRQNYSYPAELIGFKFTTIDRRDGSAENSVTAQEKDAFSGPILMTVTRRWYETASTANGIVEDFKIDTFKPRSGSYSGALFSLSYSNVLTKPFTLIDTVGTGHPTYKPGAYANNFFEQGSTPTAQPASGSTVNVSASSRQFRGGFLVETVTGVIP
tara:strand:+ start:264 stop:1562 length:1299 start_codon:yes stop_codon:yes gene_type:complete